MVDPERGYVELDLREGEGVEPLMLWYPHGALKLLAEAIGLGDLEISSVSKLLDGMKMKDLPLYIWAGTLHKDRKSDKNEICERVAFSAVPLIDMHRVVAQAMMESIVGDVDKEVIKKLEAQLQEQLAGGGAEPPPGDGETPSSSVPN